MTLNRRMLRRAFGAGVAGCVAATASAADAQPRGAGMQTEGLEDIVVTARKREEASQRVPLSITAISGAALEQRNFKSIDNLASVAPNLTITQSASSIAGVNIAIRGIIDANPTVYTNDPPIGLYLDGVYLGRTAGGIFDIVDVQRIEVLRGPQGALFGRNTTGGAVSITSSAPADGFGIQQKLSYGSFDEWSSRTRVDFGELADTGITFRVTYQHRQRNGYTNNILQPDDRDPGALKTDTVFASLHGEWDSVKWDVRGDYQARRGVPAAMQLTGASDLVKQYYALSPLLGGRSFQISETRQKDQAYDFRGFSHSRVWGLSNTLQFDASDAISLKSITAYRGLNNHEFSDLSGQTGMRGLVLNPVDFSVSVQPVSPFQSSNRSRQRQFSQELQLLGTSERLNYTAGLYYFREHVRQVNPQYYTFVFSPGEGLPPLGFNLQRSPTYTGTSKSYAVYGQASYTPPVLDDRLELTAGGRYTKDKRMIDQHDTQFGVPATSPPFARRLAKSWQNFSYNVSLAYKLTQSANLYARYATGYKSGGFSSQDINDDGYGPEKVKSYEIGLKSEWFGRRLRFNIDGFYTDYKDRQLTVFVASPSGGAGTTTQNAGRSTYKGIEAEITALPVRGLLLEGTIGYVDPKFKTYLFNPNPGDPASQPINVADQARFGYASKLTTHVAAQYTFPETGLGTPSVRVDYDHTGKRYFQALDLVSPLQAKTIDPGFDDLRAQVSLTGIPLGGRIKADLSVYGANLLNDTDHVVAGIDFGQLGFSEVQFQMPRSFGASLTITY